MKQTHSTDALVGKHSFLNKFAGKLNSITKHGEITNDKGFKLPLINSLHEKRSNTMLLTRQKQDVYSFSSQGHRALPIKSRTINLRAEKYLIHEKEKVLADLSNNFLKSSYKKQHHHQLVKKHTMNEPLSAINVNRHSSSQQEQLNINNIQSTVHGQNHRYSEYGNFMTHSEGVKKVGRSKMLVI